jgi:hypothetical protein
MHAEYSIHFLRQMKSGGEKPVHPLPANCHVTMDWQFANLPSASQCGQSYLTEYRPWFG